MSVPASLVDAYSPAEAPPTTPFSLDRLTSGLRGADANASAADQLTRLVALGLDRLPQPGSGATLTRWRALAAVAAHDLSLAKLYEGHTDALAILQEVSDGASCTDIEAHSTWGVWAAEAPNGRTVIEAILPDGTALLGGAKCWCSGAGGASHALMTAWHVDGRGPQLVRLALRQPGVEVDSGGWRAVGMAGSGSLDVRLTGAHGRLVGEPGAYLARPGFWHGGAGIAACWYGGALAIAGALYRVVAASPPASRSPYRMAALGRVDVALRGASAALREGAAWIDAHPQGDAAEWALRLRLTVETVADRVLDEVGRALGATPFCRDERFARAAADLPVFIRQSHGERDFAALGEAVTAALGPEPGAAGSQSMEPHPADPLPAAQDAAAPYAAGSHVASPWAL